jgi:plasmid maintenance system antidote protein VapI
LAFVGQASRWSAGIAGKARSARGITGDTDLRLCRLFGLSEGYFLRLQNAYDTMEAERRIAAQLAGIKPISSAKSSVVPITDGAIDQ